VGEKGAKLTGTSSERAAALAEALTPIGEITTRKMFGGNGVFGDGVMFALVDSGGSTFMRVSDETRMHYEAAGSSAHGRMPYYAVPEAVLTDDDQLLEWASKALAVAKAATA